MAPMHLFRRPDGRYYAILPAARDLLGDLVLTTVHGSVHSKMGGIKAYPAADETEIQALERQIVTARVRHGYVAAN